MAPRLEQDHGIDLDKVVLDAAGDLGVSTQLIGRDRSDETVFLYPPNGDDVLMDWWDMSLDIGDAHAIGSSIMLSSSPILYWDLSSQGTPGWIHTSKDRSTTANWIEPQYLEDHIKVAALTIMHLSLRASAREFLAPWITLALLITAAVAAMSLVYLKQKKKQQD